MYHLGLIVAFRRLVYVRAMCALITGSKTLLSCYIKVHFLHNITCFKSASIFSTYIQAFATLYVRCLYTIHYVPVER